MRTVGLNFTPQYDNPNGLVDDELIEDISYLKIDPKCEKLKLASKEEIKKQIGRSPDKGDALFLTFALPDLDKTYVHYGSGDDINISAEVEHLGDY